MNTKPLILIVLFITALFLPAAARAQDSDSDGMPDLHEVAFGCLMPFVNDAGVDYDADGLTSLAEYTWSASLNPCLADSDGDGAWDGAELTAGSNPLVFAIAPGMAKSWPDVQVTTSSAGSLGGNIVFTGSEYGVFWTDLRDGHQEVYFKRIGLTGAALGPDVRVTATTHGAWISDNDFSWTGSEYGVLYYGDSTMMMTVNFQRVSAEGQRLGAGSSAFSTRARLTWTGSEFAMTYQENLSGVLNFRRIAPGDVVHDLALSPETGEYIGAIIDWTGSEFGLAMFDDYANPYFQRISADGDTIGLTAPVDTTVSEFLYSLAWVGGAHQMVGLDPQTEVVSIIPSEEPFNPAEPFTVSSSPAGYRDDSSWPMGISQQGGGNELVEYWTNLHQPFVTATFVYNAWDLVFRARLVRTFWSRNMVMAFADMAWTGSEWGAVWSQPIVRHFHETDHLELFFARLAPDGDGDGLTNADETSLFLTNPADWDTDGDQIPDGYEQESPCLDPLLAADGALDGDTDGLTALQEYLDHGTDECHPDTDEGGEEDGHEVAAGRDPFNLADDLATVAVGSGNQDWAWPLHTSNHDARTQSIYLASDVGRAGEIGGIALYVNVPPGQALNNFIVRMKPTPLTAYPTQNPAWESAGWTTCTSGTETITASGWHDFVCPTPIYQGVLAGTTAFSAFMIDWSFDNTTASTDGTVLYFSPGGKRSLYLGADSTLGASAAWSGASPAGATSGRAPILQLSIKLDADNDGMIDAWELGYYPDIDGWCFTPGVTDPIDFDGDGLNNYNEVRVFDSSPCRADSDNDGWNDAVDCDPTDPNNWSNCATCVDADGDNSFAGCNRYLSITGPDCNDGNPNTWNTCATCVDGDGDGYYGGCNAYVTVSPDCSDSSAETWNTCWTCLYDHDFDSRVVCNQYLTSLGPDCDIWEGLAWDSCATCDDTDLDGWYGACDTYTKLMDRTIGGAGYTYTNLPFRTSYKDARNESIYRAYEIGDAGIIRRISFTFHAGPGQALNNFTVRIKPTALHNFSAIAWDGPASGWTTVFQGNIPRPATDSTLTLTLTTPYVYNGTDNLILDFSFNNSVATSDGVVHSNEGGINRTIYGAANDTYGDPLNWTGTSNPTPTATNYFPAITFYIERSFNGPDCSDTDTNNWNACASCADTDADSWFVGCNRFSTINGPDCNDGNPNTWNTCAACVDTDADLWYVGCNQYITVSGPDCVDLHPDIWNTCATCRDADGDYWYADCNRYTTMNGPDCDDNNFSTHATCATCRDDDGDGWFLACDNYFYINGPDCNDSNLHAWNTCATCNDLDGDGRYALCNNYSGIDGPDCSDTNTNAWIACATCVDFDNDGFSAACDRYLTTAGPDCSDTDPHAWDTCATCVDSDGDGWYSLCNSYLSGTRIQEIGGGTDSVLGPFNTASEDSRVETIYPAADLGAGGTITSLALDVVVPPGQTMHNFTIRMRHTTYGSFGGGEYALSEFYGPTGWTTVFQQDVEPGAPGWRTFNFTTPFPYDGIQNVMIDFSFDNSSTSTNGRVRGTIYPLDLFSYPSILKSMASNPTYGPPLTWYSNHPTADMWLFSFNLRLEMQRDINGPDCNGLNPNAWDTCASCVDSDSDNYYKQCNRYLTVTGPDCDDANTNAWDTCASCVDSDSDNYYKQCNRYLTVTGPDCDDANTNTWNTCDTCVDADSDAMVGICNRYLGNMNYSVAVGAGTFNWVSPLATAMYDGRTQSVYLNSDIGWGGTITALAFNVATVPGQTLNAFTIRLKHTLAYTPGSWEPPASGWTTVYQGNEPPGVIGWRNFTFTTPFHYDGTSNLMVDVSFKNSSGSTSGALKATSVGAGRSIYRHLYDNTFAPHPLNWSGSYPAPNVTGYVFNARFIFTVPANGPDCNDLNTNVWDSCAICADTDADNWYLGCNRYRTISGPDCNDAYPNAWDTCATCMDSDTDGWYGACNNYSGINGPDCSDTNTNVWDSCGACFDMDLDGWYVGCNRYQTINGPDCDDNAAVVYPSQPSPEGPGALCDSIDNQCPGETGYGEIDEGCVPPDADGDGLSDGLEVVIGTNPNLADTDGDGLNDGEEYITRGTDPLGWDSDGDRLPDGFEVANLSGHPVGLNLDPLAAADGAADFDGDGIVNADDYWNGGGSMAGGSGGAVSGSGVWIADKIGWPACGYWGEGDGDGFISPSDLSVISLAVKGNPNYAAVYPPNGETQDLDADIFLSPTDQGILSQMIKGQTLTVLGSRPAAIARVVPATGVNLSGAVGDALTVTVAVTNTATAAAPGIPVVFSIAASSSGGAAIVGGEGVDAVSTRYDLTTARADGGRASATLILTAAGTVTVEAKVNQCGADGIGRYCAEVLLAEPVTITVTP